MADGKFHELLHFSVTLGITLLFIFFVGTVVVEKQAEAIKTYCEENPTGSFHGDLNGNCSDVLAITTNEVVPEK